MRSKENRCRSTATDRMSATGCSSRTTAGRWWRVLEAGRPGETYNIGGNCEQKNLDVVQTICRIVDELRPGLLHAPCTSLVTFVRDRPGHDRRYAIDASKIQRELGWRPEHDFASGMRRTVRWYLDNAEWVAPRRQRRVSTRTIGSFRQ